MKEEKFKIYDDIIIEYWCTILKKKWFLEIKVRGFVYLDDAT